MYDKGNKITLDCIHCEGIEEQEFVEYFYVNEENRTKERWKCCNCGEINDIYQLKDIKN
ncbi:TPA: hypothetical protein KNT04_002655 [Clostridioides difficile]|nr:hypothetical protein [Clostridioides difficile]